MTVAALLILWFTGSIPALSAAQSVTYRSEVSKLIREIRPKPDLKEVDNFLKGVPKHGAPASSTEAASRLSNYIFNDWKIQPDNSYESRENQDNILPDSVLKKKRGHCLGISTLYLLAGEAAGIPVKLVRAPDHVFIRVCDPGEKSCVNVETLQGGRIVEDSYYITHLAIPRAALDRKAYLKSLSDPKEVLASLYLGLGLIAAKANQLDIAEFLDRKAIEASPRFADAYSNLAAVLAHSGLTDEAMPLLSKALELNPAHYPSAVNLGALHHNRKETEKAFRYYTLAIESNPLAVQAYRRRAKLLTEQTKHSEALIDLERILIIQPRYCDVAEDRDHARKALGKPSASADLTRIRASGQCLSLPL